MLATANPLPGEIKNRFKTELFHAGDCDRIETSPLICSANQWIGFYMITVSVMKELNIV